MPQKHNNPLVTGVVEWSGIHRRELVNGLRAFKSAPVIEAYRKKDLAGKSPDQIVAFAMGTSIYRAFRHESPSERYRNWRWYDKGCRVAQGLNALRSQEAFDEFALGLGESLVAGWGSANERGEPSRMNIGVAMKIINLLLKHMAFSKHCKNPELAEWLHVPWDSFTLKPLRFIWQGYPSITESASQGFVKNLDGYLQLHRLITDITREAHIPRIIYEFWAWDATHQ